MPGPSRRSAQRGGPSDRRAGAHRPRRTRRPAAKRFAHRVSWSRRLGLLAVLVALLAGSTLLAIRALDGRLQTSAVATPPPPPAVTLLAPATTITSTGRTDITAVRPPGLRQDQSYTVRLYVNGQLVRERELPAHERFTLSDVPLEQGDNRIRASLVGTGGEGERSAEISITFDDIPPEIRVTHPAAGATVYTAELTLLGRTEAAASLTITGADGREIETSLHENGRFSAPLTLGLGANRFVLRSVDAAGNRSSTRVTIERAESAASLSLAVSPESALGDELPVQLELTAMVRDELGRPVDGAQVTFSVSPPDRETTTYRVSTAHGRARWSGLVVERGQAPGVWLITALASLPSGLELRQDGSFSLE